MKGILEEQLDLKKPLNRCMSHKIPLAVFPWRLEIMENESGYGKVMGHEKLSFVLSHGNLPILSMNYAKFVWILATTITKTSNIDVESLHFPTFSTKCREGKMEKRDGHGQLRNGHGKIFCKVCGNPA